MSFQAVRGLLIAARTEKARGWLTADVNRRQEHWRLAEQHRRHANQMTADTQPPVISHEYGPGVALAVDEDGRVVVAFRHALEPIAVEDHDLSEPGDLHDQH